MPPLWALVGMGWGVLRGSIHSARAWAAEMSPKGLSLRNCFLAWSSPERRLPPNQNGPPPCNHVALYQRCQGQEGSGGGGAEGAFQLCSHPNPGCNTGLQPPSVSTRRAGARTDDPSGALPPSA